MNPPPFGAVSPRGTDLTKGKHMTDRDGHQVPGATRRALLIGAGALGAAGAVGVLAACGDDGGTPSPTTPAGGGTTAAPPAAGGPIKAADIPVNGGTIFRDQKIVVTQPTAGTFKAFDATCQHLGCLVSSVSDGKINCACHGSQYNIADGSVARGPTTAGLPAKTVTISGDTLTVT